MESLCDDRILNKNRSDQQCKFLPEIFLWLSFRLLYPGCTVTDMNQYLGDPNFKYCSYFQLPFSPSLTFSKHFFLSYF